MSRPFFLQLPLALRLLIIVALLFLVTCPLSALAQPFSGTETITTTADAVQSVYTADLDGDGDTDVISGGSDVTWYRNGDASGGGDGSAWTADKLPDSGSGVEDVHAADIDGDGDMDIIANRYDTVRWFQNGDDTGGGDGSTWSSTEITASADGASSVYAADMDGDGDMDVLSASRFDDTIAWYRNGDANGGGDGSSWTRVNVTTSAKGARGVYAADIDGDGDEDVLSASSSDDTVAWYRNGDGSGGGDGTSWQTNEISTSATEATRVVAGDLEGDGDLDVLAGKWYRNGDASGTGDGTSWTAIDIGTAGRHAVDVDGDGDADALSISSSTITWHQNEDDSGGGEGATWSASDLTTSADGASHVHASDIDGDGDPDVLSAASFDDAVAWYPNTRITEPATLYVDPDATGAADGSSWSDAYNAPQDALANLPPGKVEVWGASGTYKPDEGSGQTTGDRSASFTIRDGVELYGGFDGTDGSGGGAQETERSQRNSDPASNATVLSGDIGTADNSADNAYHVVTVPQNAKVVLDGFTVEDGNADGSNESTSRGGGVWAKTGSEPTIRNARVRSNSTAGDGGGIYSGTITVTSATISDNSADVSGGGIFGEGTFKNVTFENNSTDGNGGGIRTSRGTGSYVNLTLRNNTAYFGGGIYGLASVIEDSRIEGNTGVGLGGGIYGTSITLKGCLVLGNTAEGGGGVYALRNTIDAINTRVLGNEATVGTGGGLYADAGMTLTNVVLSGNNSARDGGALYTGGDVTLKNVSAANNSASENGNVVAVGGSNSLLKVHNSILWGSTASDAETTQQVSASSPVVDHSLLEAGVPAGATDKGGNLSQKPMFFNPRGPSLTAGTEYDDLRLDTGSPAIDAGKNSLLPSDTGSPAIDAGKNSLLPSDTYDLNGNGDASEDLPVDREGNVRRQDVKKVAPDSDFPVDMGAYEADGTPLPVELAAFEARRDGKAAVLTWKTASEKNNAGFEVQRRAEGQWRTVSFVEGAGTVSSPRSYRFRDEDLPATDSLTYRLRQVDTDGTTSYSRKVVLRLSAGPEVVLGAPSPNPLREQATIRFTVPEGEKRPVELRVYDVLGRQVATLVDGVLTPGRRKTSINVGDWTSGVYFLRLRVGEQIKSRKFTVVR